MKTITVLSGKGGVGKSAVAASLAVLLSEKYSLIAVDCDVDAPNLALVLGAKEPHSTRKISSSEKAFFDENKCNSCGKCKEVCAFSALEWNKKNHKPSIISYFCEGCGACSIVCPENAFKINKVENAEIFESHTNHNFDIISAQLKTGASGSGKVVFELRKQAFDKSPELIIVDSPAGIGCPVIASVKGSVFVVAVTEPSPSGLSDLKRALQVVEYFGIPAGIIINKFDLNKKYCLKIEEFTKEKGYPILNKLPYDKAFVEALVNLKPIVLFKKEYKKDFDKIIKQIPI